MATLAFMLSTLSTNSASGLELTLAKPKFSASCTSTGTSTSCPRVPRLLPFPWSRSQ